MSVSKNISLSDEPDLFVYKEIIPLIRKVDRYQIDMELGIRSKVIHFYPYTPNKKIIFFHKGHGSDYAARLPFVKAMLKDGYEVIEFSMPLKGINKQRDLVVFSKGVGPLRVRNHDDFFQLYLEKGIPLKFFITPVVVMLGIMPENVPIYMIGISGGGWTTLLAAALEPRIQKSVSIAGAWPSYMTSHLMKRNGDYEMVTPDFYKYINYPELMIMGAAGYNRKQLLIYNERDPCCFAGYYSNIFIEPLKRKLSSLEKTGKIDLYIDGHHNEHTISDASIEIIQKFIK